MSKIQNCLCENKPLINLSNVYYQWFFPSIYIGIYEIQLTDNVKIPGGFIDNYLIWKKHISYMTTRLIATSFVLFRVRL